MFAVKKYTFGETDLKSQQRSEGREEMPAHACGKGQSDPEEEPEPRPAVIEARDEGEYGVEQNLAGERPISG